PLFPYTTLFRSVQGRGPVTEERDRRRGAGERGRREQRGLPRGAEHALGSQIEEQARTVADGTERQGGGAGTDRRKRLTKRERESEIHRPRAERFDPQHLHRVLQ